eukprot:NODE_428_length_7645_cov_0.433740.p3 type:complete len:486 gc:universal NODE_428_length_7645_cov_0.433740:1545-3002(+)
MLILEKDQIRSMTLSVSKIPPFLQDTTNNEATTSLTLDGDHLYTCGTYPPKFSQFSLSKHSTLFSRHVQQDILKFNVLHGSKYALLMSNRNIQFHTLSKCIYTTKLPGIATHMAYSQYYARLWFSGSNLYSLDLNSGQFENTVNHHMDRINCMDYHPGHLMVAIGGKDSLSLIDSRTMDVVASVDANSLSACKFSIDGFHLATGDESGTVKVFDIRQYQPLSTIIHQYSSPIKEIKQIQSSTETYWGSLCEHQLKISCNGKIQCTIEPDFTLNDFVNIPNSGVFIIAGDSEELSTMYVPDIGPAPEFAAFMDQFQDTNTTQSTEYEHYKFITKPELRRLGLDQFIGSDLLKPVMHGYYCHHRLIDTAKHVMLDYAGYRQRELESKVEEKLSETKKVSSDDRFAIANDPDYEIDENDADFKRLKPVMPKKGGNAKVRAKQRKYRDEQEDSSEAEENVLGLPTFEDQITNEDVRGNIVYEFKNTENK